MYTSSRLKDFKPKQDLKPLIKSLSKNQKEVIKLLQKKEALITDKKNILVTCGKSTKKVPISSFYKLVNKGLVFQQTEHPFLYTLTRTGEIIEV